MPGFPLEALPKTSGPFAQNQRGQSHGLDFSFPVLYFNNQVSTCIFASNAHSFVISRECAVVFLPVVVDNTFLALKMLSP
jgi:hypothetical protein